MELVRYLHNVKDHHQGCVLSIGNYDGVHLGHQAVIRQLKQCAVELGLPAVVMIFEPQPLEFFSPETAPARLTSLRDKLLWLKQQQVDRVVCLRFQDSLARLTAREFVEQLLVKRLDVRYLVVGDDFRFGRGRTGDFQGLQEFGREFGFTVVATETLNFDGTRVSSSRIRTLLAAGSMDAAAALLGRPYTISGRIIHGDKRGGTLGFPTANLPIERSKTPLLGVYAVRITGVAAGRYYMGVVNIGTRPVFDGREVLLEVHILDFEGDIYGRHIQVEFLKFLRSEVKFGSVAELCTAIGQDIREAREFFLAAGHCHEMEQQEQHGQA